MEFESVQIRELESLGQQFPYVIEVQQCGSSVDVSFSAKDLVASERESVIDAAFFGTSFCDHLVAYFPEKVFTFRLNCEIGMY